jgi:hypothetical protein
MRQFAKHLLMGAAMLAVGGQLLQTGCIGAIQREIEILGAPEAALGEISNSLLVKIFGAGVLQFW